MALTPGTRLGAYEITGALGAGGMGEVYRARDTRLARDVAIKIIPPLFADSPERIARFEREAQILAALNHPYIAAIYGLEDSPAGRFLVLECVEGLSLAQHLEAAASAGHKGLPCEEVVPMARQIVDALEAAHEKGIIHRDLKPANIMLRPDGQVKVLDFGLARAMDVEPAANVSNSPTLTFAATQAGIILGTAAYMSPEQAKGRVADKRSDVWAFGCVLYEMLTGRRAFDGEDVSDTLAAILRGEPDWSAIPDDVPDNIRAILRRCLERDRNARIPEISVVRYLMAEPPRVSAPAVEAPQPPRLSRARFAAIAGMGVLGGLALAAAVWWGATRLNPAPVPQQVRFTIVPPSDRPLNVTAIDPPLAISPDGTHIVYSARLSGETQMMLRNIDAVDAVPVPGSINSRSAFFSPDSRWVAFWTQGELRKVAVTGGPAMRLCRTVGGPRGATWTPSGTIVLATNDPTTGLLAVPAGGGDAVKLTTPAAGSDHLFPHAVGDRDEILFTIRTLNGSASEVALFDLRTKQQVVLIAGGSDAYYVDAGYIVYGAAGAVRAVRYDAAARKVSGDPVPIQDGVMTMPSSGAASYALARAGHLLFVPGTENTQTPRRSLVWVDRQGRETPLPAEPAAYVYPRLSPDGKRLAVELREPEQDVWTLDLVHNIPARFTFDAGADGTPMWTPDGRRIIFQSSRGGAPNIYWQAADGTGPVERLTTSPTLQVPHAVTRDGKLLVFMEFTTTADLKVLRLDGRSQPETLLATEFTEGNPDLSPDDRWLVYQTNESGRFQVWVRPFPNVDSGRWQIASSGMMPVWAPNGREIFYMDGRALMSVAVETTPAFHAQKPVKLFESPYYSNSPARVFEVSRDGQRFIFVKNPSETAQLPGGRIVVVLNWLEELKAKLPAR